MDNLFERLSEPFDVDELKWKPQSVSGNRAMAICYVDARVVMDRLDSVLGVVGWQDDYELLPDGAVVCRLKVKVGDAWITKTDVGGQSEQPDGGDRLKSAFSDALKRAAVKLGCGRYLYSLPRQWCDYDPVKKQIVGTPQLPDWAKPRPQPRQAPPKNEATAQAETAKRAMVAKAAVGTINAAKNEKELRSAWAALPEGFTRVKDEHTKAVEGAKDAKKFDFLVNGAGGIDDLAGQLRYDAAKLMATCQRLGIGDYNDMSMPEAQRLKAELEESLKAVPV